MVMKKWFTVVMLLITCLVKGQHPKHDSLLSVWSDESSEDTARLEAIHAAAWKYIFVNPDSGELLATQELNFAKEIKNLMFIGAACNSLGVSHAVRGNTQEAMKFYRRSLNARKLMGDSMRMAGAHVNIGFSYDDLGDYPNAIQSYLNALALYEGIGNARGVATTQSAIGTIYQQMKEYESALEYHNKALKTNEHIDNRSGLAVNYGNVGTIYGEQKIWDKAISNQRKSLSIKRELNDKMGVAISYSNFGAMYKRMGATDSALYYHALGLALFEELKHKRGMALQYYNTGSMEGIAGNHRSAIALCYKGLHLSRVTGSVPDERDNCSCLYKSYQALNRSDSALRYYQQHILLRDSISNEENTREITQKEMRYAFAQEQMADSLQQANQIHEQELAHQAEVGRQQTYAASGILGFVLMLVIAALSFKSYRQKKKDNLLISEQKSEVEYQKVQLEEKNHEILDSIRYAKRLQQAILPPDQLIARHLPESFVFYRPKDIVAGDFYWMQQIGSHVAIAAADCTGHGVPGAMVSVVCSNALNRAVREFNLTQPGAILDRTREFVIERFAQSEEEVKDGMDVALCVLNSENGKVFYAGANNPLYHVKSIDDQHNERHVHNETHYVNEIKADKQPIGKFMEDDPFTTHEVDVSPGDMLYLFSDGFADQFGGANGKKFKYKPFKRLLLDIHNKPLVQQKQSLENAFVEWMGSHDQLDDVCIIGIRM